MTYHVRGGVASVQSFGISGSFTKNNPYFVHAGIWSKMQVKNPRKRSRSDSNDEKTNKYFILDAQTNTKSGKRVEKCSTSEPKKRKVHFDLQDDAPEKKRIKIEEKEVKRVKTSQIGGKVMRRSEAKKAMKIKRKSTNDNYSLISEAKKLWETLRRGDTPKDTRTKLCMQLHDIVKGKAKELIRKHDTGRVIQCLMIHATPDICSELFEELKDHILELSKSRYSKHFILKILRHGTKEQKDKIVEAFRGNIVKYVRQIESAQVIEFAYNQHANSLLRSEMTQEFYGPGFALFNNNVHTLMEILEADGNKKTAIMANLKENMAPILDKSLLKHTIVQHVLLEYLTHCIPQEKSEVIENIRDLVVEILHTSDGAKIALQCIWSGTVKDRKLIVKSLKGHVTKICQEKHGHLVLLAIFDCVDDTKLVRTVLLNELISNISEIISDGNGRRVIMYLLCQRNVKFFHRDTIKLLEQGDSCSMSKKDKDVRYSELVAAVSQPLLTYLTKNLEEMVVDKHSSVIVKFILKYCKGDHTAVYNSIAELITKQSDEKDGVQSLMEIPSIHLLLKSIVKLDTVNNNNVENSFCKIVLGKITQQLLEKWIKVNRCAFFLVSILETGMKEVEGELRKKLVPLKKSIAAKQTLPGQRILLSKISI